MPASKRSNEVDRMNIGNGRELVDARTITKMSTEIIFDAPEPWTARVGRGVTSRVRQQLETESLHRERRHIVRDSHFAYDASRRCDHRA